MAELYDPEQYAIAWRDALARSKAEIMSGESVPLLPILERLRIAAEVLEAEQGVTADGERMTADR